MTDYEKIGKALRENDEGQTDDILINIKKVNINDLYNRLQNDLSFYKFIELYKLMQHKMTTFEDEIFDYCYEQRKD